MIWPGCEQLKLGKSSAFVKRDLRLLPLTEAEFEADFFLDRKFSTKRREVWKGLVIERDSGALLAMEDAEWPPPTVNDLATVLAYAMYGPWFGDHQRPRVIYLQDRPQWQELLPHLRQLGIEVVLGEDLPWFGVIGRFRTSQREALQNQPVGFMLGNVTDLRGIDKHLPTPKAGAPWALAGSASLPWMSGRCPWTRLLHCPGCEAGSCAP